MWIGLLQSGFKFVKPRQSQESVKKKSTATVSRGTFGNYFFIYIIKESGPALSPDREESSTYRSCRGEGALTGPILHARRIFPRTEKTSLTASLRARGEDNKL